VAVKLRKPKVEELRASAEHFDHQHGTTNRRFGLQQLAAPVLRLLGFSNSCASNGKPQKHDIFASCSGLRNLAVQELLRYFLRVIYFRAVLYLAFFRHTLITFRLCNNSIAIDVQQ